VVDRYSNEGVGQRVTVRSGTTRTLIRQLEAVSRQCREYTI
jgi:hypothetical protein